jgi:hypothetical protein
MDASIIGTKHARKAIRIATNFLDSKSDTKTVSSLKDTNSDPDLRAAAAKPMVRSGVSLLDTWTVFTTIRFLPGVPAGMTVCLRERTRVRLFLLSGSVFGV